jgi:hypothetical protein
MVEESDGHGGRVPPIGKRWKPGQSGNPKGRPKKEDSLTSLLKEEIEKLCPADRENRTWKELVVRATLQLAMKGNGTALKEVWGRHDGKIPQTENLHLAAPGGVKIDIVDWTMDADSVETELSSDDARRSATPDAKSGTLSVEEVP